MSARAVRATARRFVATWALVAAAAAAAAPPQRITAGYDLYRNGNRIGTITETFERRDGVYRIRSETRATGLLALVARGNIVVTSEGTVAEGGLRPQRFEHQRGSDPAGANIAEFDWSGSRLVLRHGGTVESVHLERPVQDRLSAMYQFMFLQLAGTTALQLAMTNGTKLEHYRYEVLQGEAVQTPIARFSTIRLVKQRAAQESGTEIWLAADRHQFPVRVVVTEADGDRLEQVLSRLDVVD